MADELDLRGSIEQAMDADTDASVASETPEPISEASSDDGQAASRESNASPADGKVRDGLGRFVSKDGENAPAAAPAPGQPAVDAVHAGQEQPAAAPAEPASRPPLSWNAQVREHWAALPPAVQQEVNRRELEVQQALSNSHQARQMAGAFQQAIQPHMMTIQAEGVDPLTAVTNLMQVGTRLRFGTPAEKAQQVAQIVNAYGVDIMALDGALSGQAPQQAQGGDQTALVQQLVQQQLQPIMMAAQQRQQAQVQQQYQAAASEATTFAQSHEFYGDLRLMMADMIEVADRQGINLSLDDAYQRAAMLHPDVSRVMMARQQGANAQNLTAAARRAKSAAVSVRGGAPVGNPEGREPSSVRDSIEMAIESHSRI